MLVDALGDDLEGVDVEAGVGLVEDRQAGLEHRHLEDLEPLLLAAGEAVVQVAARHRALDVKQLHRGLHLLAELAERNRVGLAVGPAAPVRVDGLAEERRDRHAGDRVGVLEAEEEARSRALVRLHLENVSTHVGDRPGGHLVAGMAHQDVREGRLPGAVRAHDGVDLTP